MEFSVHQEKAQCKILVAFQPTSHYPSTRNIEAWWLGV